MEEMLAELKEVLKEVEEQREVAEERDSREGGLRATLRNLCRDALAKAVASTKQDLVKVRHYLVNLEQCCSCSTTTYG